MEPPEPGRLRFSKMHGAGNDFVVLDLRDNPALAARFAEGDVALFRALADRRTGIGCDSIMTVEPPRTAGAVAAYGIRNADGSTSRQCGNGARCIAAWLVREGSARGDRFALDSPAGRHDIEVLGNDGYRIAMGVPQFDPRAVPLSGFAEAHDAYTLEIDGQPVRFGAVSFGNPHAVIEVDDVAQAPVESLGKRLQGAPAFPEGLNAGFVQVMGRDRVRLRVYERGAGETQACGSGACAAAVVLMRRGRIGREVDVSLPGGDLHVSWPSDDASVLLSGPTAFVFEGEFVIQADMIQADMIQADVMQDDVPAERVLKREREHNDR